MLGGATSVCGNKNAHFIVSRVKWNVQQTSGAWNFIVSINYPNNIQLSSVSFPFVAVVVVTVVMHCLFYISIVCFCLFVCWKLFTQTDVIVVRKVARQLDFAVFFKTWYCNMKQLSTGIQCYPQYKVFACTQNPEKKLNFRDNACIWFTFSSNLINCIWFGLALISRDQRPENQYLLFAHL